MKLLDPDVIREGAGCGPIGRRVLVFRETSSTNDLALKMGEGGEPEGLVIFAESQTAGRGQFKRPWHSADGLGLWFSILIRRDMPRSEVTLLTPYAAVGVADGLAEFFGEPLGYIKRPNDIYGRRGKIAGILIETRMGGSPFAVIGIGLNVNQAREDFAPEIRETASSLFMETGRIQDREAVACAVLRILNQRLAELTVDQRPFLGRYEELALR